MKGVYLVTILYVVILSVVALNQSPVVDPTKCPENNPWNETVFVPHENDCTKFYNCHMGKKGKPLDCPFMDNNGNRLHFNPKLQVCDWPSRAGCQVSSSTLTTPLSSSISPTTSSPSSPTPTIPSPSSLIPTTSTSSSSTPTTPSSSTPTTPSSPTPSSSSPIPTTPTSSSATPTSSSATPTTPSSPTSSSNSPIPTSSPTSTTPSSSTPSSSSPTPTSPTSSSPTPTTPSSPTSSSNSPIPTTPTSSSATPTSSSATPTTSTPSSSTSTAPSSSTPSSSSPIPTTPTSSSATPTTPSSPTSSSNSPIPTSSPTSTTPSSSTPSSSSPTPTSPTSSSPTPTTPSSPTSSSNSPIPTTPTSSSATPTSSSATPTTSTPSSSTSTTPSSPIPSSSSPIPTAPTSSSATPTSSSPTPTTPSSPTSSSNSPIPTTPTSSSATPTSSSATPTTSTPSSSTSTTPSSSTPSSSSPIPTTPTSSSATPTTPSSPTSSSNSPIPTSSPTSTTPSSSTPSSSSPTPTSPTSSSPTPTTPSSPTSSSNSPIPTTPTSSSATPTSSSATPTTPSSPTSSSSSPIPTSSPTSTTPSSSTPSSSSPTPTSPTSSSPTPTTPSSPTSSSNSPIPTTPTSSSATPTSSSATRTTSTPSSSTSTTPSSPTPSSSSPTPTSPTSSSLTTSSLNSCDSDGRIHMIPHKTMCDHYYYCFDGMLSPIPQKCDRNLLFNPVLRVCDYPENVNCTINNNIPLSTNIGHGSTIHSLLTTSILPNPSSTSPLLSPVDPTKSVDPSAWVCVPNGKIYKVPHETMCNYYYWCNNGVKGTEPIKCESYLLFNPLVGECDYPENVDCEGRSTPLPDTTTKPTTTITTKPPTTTTTTESPTTTTTESTTTTTTTKSPTTTTTTESPTTTTTTESPTTTTTTESPTTTTTTESPTTTTTTESPTTTTTTEPSTTRNPNIPRENCPPKGSTEKARIAHPCLCNQYYECVDGEKILQSCPIGKHFDYVKEVCDWATIVKCIRPIPILDTLIDIDYDTTCAPEGRALQHETDCSAYYLCSNGKKILKFCLEGLHFNVSIQMCDYPQKKCDLTKPLPTTTLDVCPPAGSVEKVLLPHECECTQYYECINGTQVLRDCPNDLYYDYIRQICNDPTKVKCVNFASTVPTISSSIPKSDLTCYDDGSEIPHEYDCGLYYKCSGGEKILKTCSRNLYFNPKLRVCDFPENVVCKPGSVNVPTMPIPTKCYPTIKIDKIPHETDCNLYYVCQNGISTLKKCHSPELVFNPILKVCDFPENYICNMTRTKHNLEKIDKIIENFNPTTCIGTCPEEDPEYVVLLPNDDCKKFCMCSNGLAYVQPCPEPLYFDSVDKVCKHKKDAVCAKRSSNEDDTFTIHNINKNWLQLLNGSNTEKRKIHNHWWSKLHFYNLDPSTCIGTCPEEDPEYAVLLPNDDCKKFCLCSNGLAYVQPCPEPLYFDSVDKVCKHKKDAVCAKRSSSQDNAFTIYNITYNSLQRLNKSNTEKRKIYNNLWAKLHFYNLDPSTCIGTCPEEDPEYAVLLPNDDCKKFCLCSNGLAYVQPCPEPLYFDSVDKVCKHKKDAVCAKRSSSQDNAFAVYNITDNSLQHLNRSNTEKRKIYNNLWTKLHFYNLDPSTCIGTCPEEDPEYAVLLPNDDCKKFCLCSNGLAYVQPCPEPLYFDSVDKVCKHKKDAVCAIRSFDRLIVSRKFNEDNLDKSLSEENYNERRIYNPYYYKRYFYDVDPSTCIGICPEENSEYVIILPHEDCRKFCICNNGLAYIHLCPEPLYFHPMDKICRQRRYVVCTITINTEDDEDDSLEYLNDDESDEHGYTNYLSSKPPLHSFTISACIGICSKDDSVYSVLYPNEDCKKFCLCRNGVISVQSCPEPLYFDSIDKICKRKEHAVCGVQSNQDNIIANVNSSKSLTDENDERRTYDNLDPSTCIGTCPEEDPEYAVLLPNDDCKKFCMCSNGVAWVLSCPDPLYFDNVEKICKQKKDAVCGVRSDQDNTFMIAKVHNDNSLKSLTDENDGRGTYDNLDPSTCIGTCPEEDPEYAVLLPNDDCKKFCMCSNGVAWVLSCPDPLYFDNVEKICKQKKDAVCGIRSDQDNTFMIAKFYNDNSLKSLTDENDGRETYDNLDPSTCIGTCPEEDPEYAVLLPNDDCKKFCMCSNGVAWVLSCPDPLYFDNVEKICKQKKDAVCGVRSYV